jgi:hypothetical protein
MNSQVKNQMCISEHLSSPTVFSEVTIFSFICMFCRSLFVLLYAFDPSQSYVNSLPDDVLYDLRVSRLYPEARWNTDYTYDQMCISEHLSSPTVFSEVTIFSFMCMFCRSLFVLLYFFFWPARLYPEARWNTDYTYDFAQTASPRTLEADGDPPGKYTVM